jgi:hypothetical protein
MREFAFFLMEETSQKYGDRIEGFGGIWGWTGLTSESAG